ncbi:MAG: TonB-dependent receptor [Tannerella sp.]|nr:TonB-dependent receptor [Tannerella sp.]
MLITLLEDAKALEEVVVVGYGTQKKVNLTGSVSSISGEAITKRPVINAVSMLQGLLPGVRVVQNNGQPGGSFTMQIHGYGTFSGAGVNPMVLIDGVEGDMASLDPNTIQSVSVLKDAASAAIYGSRAANGVILVTTKDGSSPDGKLKVAYHYNYGIHSPTKMLDMVTNSADYMTAWNTRIRNTNYGVDMPARQYPQEEIEKYRNATDRIQYPNFDWVDFIVNPAPTQMHNLSVSGGKQTRYNFSLGYFDEKGTMEAFWYKRYNGQLNIVSDVSKRLKIGVNVNLKKGVKGEEGSGQENYFGCVLAQAPTYMPTLPDGSGRYSWRAYPFEECNWNPYLMLKEQPTTTDDYDVKAQAWSDFEILDGLHWYVKAATNYRTSQFSAFVGNSFYEQIYRYPHGDGYQLSTSLNKSNTHTLYTNLHSYLDYNKRFGVHQVGVMFGYSSEENKYNEMGAYRREYASPLIPELNAGAPDGQTNSGTSNAWAMQSVFGRLNYSFRDKYLLEADMRYDGTSRLSPDSRWGLFPSFSAGWRISEEQFMESTRNWLSNLKIRGSWGQLGNQNIGLYPYQAMLSFSGVYPFDNSTLVQGVAQTSLNNYNIKWETTTTTGLGLDVTLYNKLSLTLDVYRKLTTDILRSAQVNALVGLSAPTINNGSVQNTGYDLDIKYQDRVQNGIWKGLTYDVGVIVGGFKNKLVEFGTWEDGGSVMREEGRPWNTFYLLQVEGIFQSAEEVANAPKQFGENTQPGMLKYKDVNGDNKIDNTDRVPMEKGVFPDCTYGFTLNGAWKGFDLYGFFQGVAGSKVYVTGWGLQPFVQGSAPTKDQFANAWTPENHSTKYVMLGDPVSYSHPSTYLLKDNSYFRLKTLQFGYSLPGNLIGKVGLSRLRIYFSGDNLLTFTNYEGLDPERSGNGRYVSYPQNKVVSFGCNIEF